MSVSFGAKVFIYGESVLRRHYTSDAWVDAPRVGFALATQPEALEGIPAASQRALFGATTTV